MYQGGHFKIDGSHDLIQGFYDGNCHTPVGQVFRHFKADKAAAHHHRPFGPFHIEPGLNAIHIGHRAEGENSFQVQAGYGRSDRFSAGGENQGIIGFGIGFAGFPFNQGYGFMCPVNGGSLSGYPYINMKGLIEFFGGHYEELFPLRDHSSCIVGQTAVGIGNVISPFYQDDFRMLIISTKPGRGGGPAGNAADDNVFRHDLLLLMN